MSTRTFPAYTLHCDVCGTALTDQNESPWWFADLVEARLCALAMRWIVADRQYAVCDQADSGHAAAILALMPPEPAIETEGQLALGEDADGPA